MKNFLQKGDILTMPAPSGGVVSGNLYIIGSIVGVAQKTAAEGELVAFHTEGVFRLPKTSAQAWTVGVKVYWDGSVCTTTSSGNKLIGAATAVAANPSSTGDVWLNKSLP